MASPLFRSFGGHRVFGGPIATLQCFEDNSRVRDLLGTTGEGRVLVIDGGASLRCALVGDRLAQLAADNGWTGILVNGCVRDSRALSGIPIGILALAAHPLRSVKKGLGAAGIPVSFAGVVFAPGEYLYADEDGVIVSGEPIQAG
ncbi:MAG: ribonuclease E activity regulator RraA [Rhodocyclaceae bacterium]